MGSTDQMIRSEFSVRRFERGSVGLASSGKDTESCQFFITYSPKPHLDGRYTVFAEIVEGMDVIDQLVVGDQIISARLEAIKEN
jgi:cyclophilin family peptidyl-prolyl cis-trans isomerase